MLASVGIASRRVTYSAASFHGFLLSLPDEGMVWATAKRDRPPVSFTLLPRIEWRQARICPVKT